MTISLGDIIVKIGADGQPVTSEAYRKFRVVGTGSVSDSQDGQPETSKVLTIISVRAIE